jgi:signal transduction histidine kinase
MKLRRNSYSLSTRLLLAQISIVVLTAAVVAAAFHEAVSRRIDQQLQLFATSTAASLMPIAEASPHAAAAFAGEIAGYHAQSMSSAFDVKDPPELLYQLFDSKQALRLRSSGAPVGPMFSLKRLPPSVDATSNETGSGETGERAPWFAEVDIDGHVRTGNRTVRKLEAEGPLPPPDARGQSVFKVQVDSPPAGFSTGVVQSSQPPVGPGVARPSYVRANGNAQRVQAPLTLRTQQSASAASIPGPIPMTSTWRDPSFETMQIAGKRWRAVRLQDAQGRQVQAALPAEWRRRAILTSLKPLLLHGTWALPLAALLTWLIGRYTMAPLHRLASLVRDRTPTDLSPLRPDVDYSEVQPLVSEVNRLMGQLQKLLSVERDAFSNAAHELLTPIAVIQAQAYVLRVAGDDSARERAAAHLDEGLQRVSTLIRQLLMLAKAGATAPAAFLQEADLVPPLQERVAAAATRAIAKGIDLTLHCPRSFTWRFDHDTLMAAVDNLLDNAIRYSPPESSVSVALIKEDDAVMLVVTDGGPGIPSEHLEHVKERFFRVPGTLETGSGLGLAITDCAAQLHGGTLDLLPGPLGQGLQARLRLSLRPDRSRTSTRS